jgi:hypothetical protein
MPIPRIVVRETFPGTKQTYAINSDYGREGDGVRKRSLSSIVTVAVLAGTATGYALSAERVVPKVIGAVAAQAAPEEPPTGRVEALRSLLPANEASALVASRTQPGVYYWLRDGGPSKPDRPRDAIWAMRLDAAGNPLPVRGSTLFPSYDVKGAKNVDWEDLAVDDTGALWIGELGANDCKRQQRLYRTTEPLPGSTAAITVSASYDLRFTDDLKSGCRTYNSEAMFWLDGHLYVFAKTAGSPVYRVDLPSGTGGTARLTRVTQVGQGVDNISASSLSDDRTRLMLLDHERMWVFRTDPARRGDDLVEAAFAAPARWQARFQAEGGASVEGGSFAWGTHTLAFVAEDRRIYVADPRAYGDDPGAPPLPPLPSTVCPTPPAFTVPNPPVVPARPAQGAAAS